MKNVWMTIATAGVAILTGCKAERIEYHRRPAFYEKASEQPLTDEVVLEDGTVLRFSTMRKPGVVGHGGDDGSKPFEIREEHEDGTVTMRALLPQHILSNLLTCVRNQEYQLIWEHLIAERARTAYESSEGGVQSFLNYFRTNRHELTATLTRMIGGIPTQETSFTKLGDGITRCRLRPQIAEPFKFRMVDVVQEEGTLKVLMIQ